MSLITTDHTSRPETHTPTHTLGVIRARLLPFLPPSCHFTSDRDRNSSMQLTPVLSTACTVCLLAHFCPCTHVYTLKNRERERWSGARIHVLVLSEWKLLFSSHVCGAANQANASVMKWGGRHLSRATDEHIKARAGTQTCVYKHTRAQPDHIRSRYFCSNFYMTPTLLNFIHLLLSCWQVTESPLSLTELWEVQDLHFGLRGRKLTRLQLISGLWKNKSFQRLLILQWQCFCLVKYFSKMLPKPAALTISWTSS